MFDFDTITNRTNYKTMRYLNTLSTSDPLIPSFAASESDFKMAPILQKTFTQLANDGFYQYHIADTKWLQKICWWSLHSRNSKIDENWIVPTPGTIYTLGLLIRNYLKSNEKIVILTPSFDKYEIIASINNRRTTKVPLILQNNHYKIDFDKLEIAMADSLAKIFILCNPHNPIGQVWNQEELKQIIFLVKKYNLLIFSDEIFADITFDHHRVTPIWELYPEGSFTNICLNKTFCLTGLCNANYIIPNIELRQQFIKIRDKQHFGCIEALAYCGILDAFSPEGLAWVQAMNKYINNNINFITNYLSQNIPSIHLIGGEGSFVVWLDCRNIFKNNQKKLMELFQITAKFDVINGERFGLDGKGFVRMSVACPIKYIEEALERLNLALKH